MFRALGHRDVPLEDTGDDALRIEPYANGLSTFAGGCETPMTVGLQGEWGSGKTSLMKLVRKRLEASGVETFWFETWQYGAMGNAETLGMHLMRDLTNQLMARLEDDDRAYKVKQRMSSALRSAFPALVGAAVSAVGGNSAGTAVSAGLGALASSGGRSDMRSCFGALVEQALADGTAKGNSPGRLVVFIDDLDRVQPALAVRLLEVLKNFMDVPRCVFIVACDYEVVREGVQELMGIRADGGRRRKEKVDAFFHKLFQVQFLMPVGSYRIDALFESYLRKRLNDQNQGLLGARRRSKRDAERMVDNFITQGLTDVAQAHGSVAREHRNDHWFKELKAVVHSGVGTNPRAFKRYLNLVDLTCCVDQASPDGALARWSIGTAEECVCTVRWCTALFPVVALQQRWPEIAPYLLNGVANLTRSGTGGADASYTDFERRLRTICGRWPTPASADDADEVGTSFEDELVAELLSEHYRHDGHDAPALVELRQFCGQWFDLLNNTSDTDRLTSAELQVIARWSERLGEMGTTTVRVSGLAKLRLTCMALDKDAGDGFVAFASYAVNRARGPDDGLDHIFAQIDDDAVRVSFATSGGGRKQLLKLMPNNGRLEVRVYAKAKAEASAGLPGLTRVGDQLRQALVGVGFEVHEGQPTNFVVDFAVGHSAERHKVSKPLLKAFLEDVESLVIERERRSLDEPASSAAAQAPPVAGVTVAVPATELPGDSAAGPPVHMVPAVEAPTPVDAHAGC